MKPLFFALQPTAWATLIYPCCQIGRGVRLFGTIVFALYATHVQLLAGQIIVDVLSSNTLCLLRHIAIFVVPALLLAVPRSLDRLSWFKVVSSMRIFAAAVVD